MFKTEDPEYDDIPLEKQETLYYLTRSINGIVFVFLLFFLYVLFSIKQKFTFQNLIILQIIITRFIHSSYSLFPIINSADLESSWMCTAQTIVINLSLFCLTLHVLTILIVSYNSLVRPESLKKNKKCKQISFIIFNWIVSIGFSSIFLFTENRANPVGNCRGNDILGKVVNIGWYVLLFFISNIIIICKLIMKLKLFMHDSSSVIKKYLQKVLLFNINTL